ncbi:hypothetical protein ACQPXM_10340 [Kribbella sp. CA-253562]|uniref:hypothetical protein n=1 Tax=Kribbella sp. CA-253562 TaxID=3239942 RepID=UPI003D89C0F4
MTELLTTASVAAAVTLVIEYSAKPHLEARKERILERERSKRKTAQLLLEVSQIAGQLGRRDEITRDTEVRRKLAQHNTHLRERLVQISDDLVLLAPAFAVQLPEPVAKSLGLAMGHIKGAAQSSKLNAEVAAELAAVTGPVADYLASYRFISKVLALHRVRQISRAELQSAD